MLTLLPSDLQEVIGRAVREQGDAFRVSSLFVTLPSNREQNAQKAIALKLEEAERKAREARAKVQELANLSTIPAELLLLIFPHLSRISSICLGLTCKAFYAIHRSFLDTPVGLHERDRIHQCHLIPLYQLLKKWKGPDLVAVHPSSDRCFFVEREVVETWLKKGKGMNGFLGIKIWA